MRGDIIDKAMGEAKLPTATCQEGSNCSSVDSLRVTVFPGLFSHTSNLFPESPTRQRGPDLFHGDLCSPYITLSSWDVCDIFHHRPPYPDEKDTVGRRRLFLQEIPAYIAVNLIESLLESGDHSTIRHQCTRWVSVQRYNIPRRYSLTKY